MNPCVCSCLAFALLSLAGTALADSPQNDAIFGAQQWRNRRRGGGRGSLGGRGHTTHAKLPNLGVNYGLVANNLPAPETVGQMLQGTIISSVKLYEADATVLRALSHTGLSVVVGVPDENIPMLGTSPNAAVSWVETNIVPFYPTSNIVTLVVGNEVLSKTTMDVSNHLVRAMENLYTALLYSNIQNVSVSTTHSMAVLATSFPPSAAQFQPELLPLMRQVLSFLSSTSSPFMSNSYPYFAYKQNPEVISLDYALFRQNAGVTDSNSGLHYSNLFDAQVDAIYGAMKALGYDNIPVVVAESGWPSAGDPDELGASVANAQEYNANLIKHINANVGTPAKPNIPIYTYIFALFNENMKPGPTSERNFGLFHPDESQVYDVGLKISEGVPPSASTNDVNLANTTTATMRSGTGTWCVAKPSMSSALLQQILLFCCGEGGADCSPIQPKGSCFSPNNLIFHASYAMNSYYQRQGRNVWNCDFNGGGMISPNNPSYGACNYPTQ
ncbi:hypothetical protein GOP47_0011493 [Adiantum capillus-veneris]|uniref:glucan endo-1,3-beta-D-glucosidase n=1 Tax=Adiantum capillus-veneris TaxID=13818 RepID=A0A9D4ZHQ4_ADICA|nr:hypothetical protein GOP47_0011493 [Adiantum capillus-veneris]